MNRTMEELKHGTEEMTQYIITLESGKQIRVFISAEDWKDEYRFTLNVLEYCDVEKISRYSAETVTVE